MPLFPFYFMKRVLAAALFCLLTVCSYAESIRLTNGVILVGSITNRTEYAVDVLTKYSEVTVPLRDIVEIMPDKYVVKMQSGQEFLGVIKDMDEFNLTLETDSGVINLDMPKVAALEVYDYAQGEKQEAYIASREQAAIQAEQTKAAGGIVFDEDLEKAFSSKSSAPREAVVSARPAAAPITVSSSAPAQAVAAPVIKEEPAPEKKAAAKEEKPKKEKKQKEEKASNIPEDEKEAWRYVSVEAGALSAGLKFLGEDIGGVNAHVEFKYLFKVLPNLWVGPTVGLSMVPKTTFEQGVYEHKTSGSILHLGAGANYYIFSRPKTRMYLTAQAGLERLSVNYRYYDTSDPQVDQWTDDNFSSNSFYYGAGAGAEYKFSDFTLGLEGRYNSVSRGDRLSESDSAFYTAVIKISWKF